VARAGRAEPKKAVKGAKVQRVVFNAITKTAVLEAMANPRDIDMELVEAYLARRALDYLVGFTLSPVLWRKLPGSRSAGRVQSVACASSSTARWRSSASRPRNTGRRGRRLGRRRSVPGPPGQARGKALKKFDLNTRASASAARAAVQAAAFTVAAVEKKPAKRTPPPPFTTSTLQQEASRKLGFSPSAPCRPPRSCTRASTSAARRWV
jgi:DNA topoisomerase-1